jgi:hypothetical protein
MAKPETAAPLAYLLYYIKNAQSINKGELNSEELGVRAIDDFTFQVELRAPRRRVAEPCGPDGKSFDAYAREWTDERALHIDINRAVAQAGLHPCIDECLLVAYQSVDQSS